jgi:hypothetical protein
MDCATGLGTSKVVELSSANVLSSLFSGLRPFGTLVLGHLFAQVRHNDSAALIRDVIS